MRWAPIILASASPRRQEILRSVQLPFAVMPSGINESRNQSRPAEEYARKLAELKAGKVGRLVEGGLVIGADTVVVTDSEVLEKPRDEQEAKQMLRLLSGGWHRVITGICLIKAETLDQRSGYETTRVRFAPMEPDEVDWYVSTGEPMGKAGAYAIQGYGALFIERIEGDYLNVVGLPLRLVYRLAGELGLDLKGCVAEPRGEAIP